MKNKNLAIFLYITSLMIALTLLSSCVSKHPKCAAYDNVQTVNQ
jgi:hypothetical protein